MRLTAATFSAEPGDHVTAAPSTYQPGRVHLRIGPQVGVFLTDAQADQLEQQLAARRHDREIAEVIV